MRIYKFEEFDWMTYMYEGDYDGHIRGKRGDTVNRRSSSLIATNES